ncbi:DUF488 domain-containing protein [Pasteurella atlantica]|uniref:DUF488 domain-containing protein n=1 Tax=Pasteurellaceae TaxID=712 RepID=UPI00274F1A13|nr:DUF488 domain-containing protein [Pasteurella atlantica]MDP8033843.1 DUF488 domain-containing protein [Pasteurella atlantica]MDP8035778.1 DUF488 domain-containing protein [Pasteurella atlantica]MDP8037687.1 DUF488 domain-containing protein [Pasteurella atlantica]MDP8048079.1 DUF488 domain-containing protein [Pasteurella atlantica]MDP8050102.1 DUF488 domain-containing protein [Pasteurella atlantica]
MDIYTIGFTKKNAETFFGFIKSANIKTLIDVRINNISQLAGFAKRDDLRFFLKSLCNVDYIHMPELAPTQDLLNAYKKGNMSWDIYEDKFLNLMAQRNIERVISSSLLEQGCLLCSEHKPHLCHRRLIIEYLNENSNLDLKVKHLY